MSRSYFARPPCLSTLADRTSSLARSPARSPSRQSPLRHEHKYNSSHTQHFLIHLIHPCSPSCCSRTASIRISSSISASASFHTHSPFTSSSSPHFHYRTGIFYFPSSPSRIERVYSHQSRCTTMIPFSQSTTLNQRPSLVRLCFFLRCFLARFNSSSID